MAAMSASMPGAAAPQLTRRGAPFGARTAARRPSRLACAPRAAQSPQPGREDSGRAAGATPPSRTRSLAARLLGRSTAQEPVALLPSDAESQAAAEGAQQEFEEQQQVAAAAWSVEQHRQQQQQQQAEEPAAPPQQQAAAAARSGAFSLYSWLTWGSGKTPTAAPSSGSESDSDSDGGLGASAAATVDFGDGMAAVQPTAQPVGNRSSSSRTSYWRSRRQAAAAPAAPAEPAQRVPLDHPALQLLRQRALAGSRPGARRDPFKLGLVVEGGGMRGCVSGGALQALTDVGLRDAFDAVYGSSAGAINSTFFLSGQRSGVTIYHDHIANPDFIDLKRLWRSRGSSGGTVIGAAGSSASLGSTSGGSMDGGEPTPVLNLAYLIDHVMDSVLPLDWEAVLASPVPLKVVASSLDTLSPVLLSDFEDRHDLAACLKASATVPAIAGGPRFHRGQMLVDAAVFEPVPFRSAIADGCTHLLVLATRPLHLTRRSRVNSVLADAVEVAIKRAVLSPDYMREAWKAELEYFAKDGLSQDDMLLQAATQADAHTLPWFAGAHVLPIFPGTAANFSPLCIDPPTLRAGVADGRRTMLAVCRALLGDARDFSRFHELEAQEANNIVPSGVSSSRLWRRYIEENDFSHHA